MARRRLSPTILESAIPDPSGTPPAADVPRAEHSAGLGGSLGPGEGALAGPAPIARVAAEAAGRAALDEVVETLRRARDEGRMVIEIPLDDIAADHLARDRLARDGLGRDGLGGAEADEDMVALRESLRAHGQRMPVEVTPLRGPASDEGSDGGFNRGLRPFGLISGWRRLAALRALHAETGAERFATVKALVRRPDTAAEAYVAMVEENEIRLGLSQYERARIAAIAAARGIFPSEKAALLGLFAQASRAKRSRIRAFVEIYHALDPVLRFPAHLPERLGLRLVELLRAGRGEAIAAALAAAAPADPEAELAALEAVAARLEAGPEARAPKAGRPADDTAEETTGETAGTGGEGAPAPAAGDWRWERLGPDLELGFCDGARPEWRLRGGALTAELRTELAAALRAVLAGAG